MNVFLQKQLTSILPSSFGTSIVGQTMSIIEQVDFATCQSAHMALYHCNNVAKK
jgi:hypothetical protein